LRPQRTFRIFRLVFLFIKRISAKPDQAKALVDWRRRLSTGRLDFLINNAGGSPASDAATASPRFVEAILKLNLVGPLYMAQAAYPHLKAAGGGSIINIASVSGARPSPGDGDLWRGQGGLAQPDAKPGAGMGRRSGYASTPS
jgi:NAD(P)-dependent dehydrogenase (short-subunit alcohol dehydrogenase family)